MVCVHVASEITLNLFFFFSRIVNVHVQNLQLAYKYPAVLWKKKVPLSTEDGVIADNWVFITSALQNSSKARL